MGALTYILISLAFSAFFSGMEIAFISSNKLRFELDKKEKSLTSKILDIFYRNPHQFISTMLVGNNIALVVYGLQMAIILEPLIARVVNNEALIVLTQSIISTILILFTGEFIPKTVFKLNPNFSLTLFSVPLLIIYVVLSSEMFKNPEDWTQSIRSVSIVPETMAANKLMKVLMQDKKSMAVVVDEFGGTSGIVTLEDLVEEIFGEIEDEHDIKSYVAKKVGDDEYLLSGRIEIDTLNEKFDLELPESDDYVTIAGFILHFYQKFPKLNETIVIDKYSFKIVKVTATKIELVRMKVVS